MEKRTQNPTGEGYPRFADYEDLVPPNHSSDLVPSIDQPEKRRDFEQSGRMYVPMAPGNAFPKFPDYDELVAKSLESQRNSRQSCFSENQRQSDKRAEIPMERGE
uniref:Uncharacterized protein n=1 Tax=Lygus hesperus TaxID=30085 RepID=A0A0K8SNE9_LYGHE